MLEVPDHELGTHDKHVAISHLSDAVAMALVEIHVAGEHFGDILLLDAFVDHVSGSVS